MNNKLTPSQVLSRSSHKVVANFTNGFAQNVIELDNGMVLFISYDGTEVEITQTTPLDMDDPQAISKIVNATPEEE